MARLFADHNFSQPLIRLLREHGHDAVTTGELRYDRATDGAVLQVSAEMLRIDLTYNERDFVLLHDAWLRWTLAWGIAPTHPGIIVLPQDRYWEPRRAVREIESVLREDQVPTPSVELTNQIWLWQSARGWIEASPALGSPSNS